MLSAEPSVCVDQCFPGFEESTPRAQQLHFCSEAEAESLL